MRLGYSEQKGNPSDRALEPAPILNKTQRLKSHLKDWRRNVQKR